MTDGILACPHCGGLLSAQGGSMKCPSGHSYDIASGGAGYVNLLTPGAGRGHEPGDGKDMVAARTRFLDTGAYAPLRSAVASITAGSELALDICCGEGYYTRAIAESCVAAAAFDISKHAVKKAAKRCAGMANAALAVAGGTAMPVAAASCDAAVELFAPLFPSETARVVRSGGRFVFVSPGAGHLAELKAAIYDSPRPNGEHSYDIPGFAAASREKLTFRFELGGGDAAFDLYAMTPYFWRSSAATAERVREIDSLGVTAEFLVAVYVRQ